MGIDLSKSNPGIAIVDIEQNKILYNDNFKETKNKSIYVRFLELQYWIDDIINIFKPSIVMLEAPFISMKSTKGNDTLLQLNGYIRHFIKSKGIKIYTILPSSARAFLNIKPNTKESAFEWIQNKFPEMQLKDFKKENDKADSIIVALNYFNEKKQEIFEV